MHTVWTNNRNLVRKLLDERTVVKQDDSGSVATSGCLGHSTSVSAASASGDLPRQGHPAGLQTFVRQMEGPTQAMETTAQQENAEAEQTPARPCNANQAEGKCTACVFVARNLPCTKGAECEFCHDPRCANRIRVKPGKGKRARMRKVVQQNLSFVEQKGLFTDETTEANQHRNLVSI
mmetsp:Transcript_3285/g.6475  ORF Transcript_3285/g.6475 Transcript_3285/m.6475 type:complete len:178 (-) Transcript_3285:171-704(-)